MPFAENEAIPLVFQRSGALQNGLEQHHEDLHDRQCRSDVADVRRERWVSDPALSVPFAVWHRRPLYAGCAWHDREHRLDDLAERGLHSASQIDHFAAEPMEAIEARQGIDDVVHIAKVPGDLRARHLEGLAPPSPCEATWG